MLFQPDHVEEKSKVRGGGRSILIEQWRTSGLWTLQKRFMKIYVSES